MPLQAPLSGRLIKAPENFLQGDGVRAVFREGKAGRRDFVRGAFAAALAGAAAPAALGQAQPTPPEGGDPNILVLPAHTKGLGQPVVTDGYGKPSRYEANVQRRQSPGLTQTTQASVSFALLQSLFGIVTPSGLHFERHHQGWWDIDPSKHRLMLNGSDEKMLKRPLVFSVDEIMRLPSVGRFHFIECGANTGMEWGNVAVPTCQYTHGMISRSEFTGVPLKTLLVKRVDVSVDGGRHWKTARLQGPVMDKCLTRFSLDWAWGGKPAIVMSRAIDDTGHVQPNYRQLRAVRGSRSIYHNNAIQSWLAGAGKWRAETCPALPGGGCKRR